MPLAQVNGLELYYEDVGQGPPLVLLHGGWRDHHMWDSHIPELAKEFRVIAYDRRGCGQSTKVGEEAHAPEIWAEDLRGLITALKLAPTYICGQSYGGMTTLEFLLRFQDLCKGAIIVSATSQGFRSRNPPAVPFTDITRLLSRINVPCLIVQGTLDAGMPPAHAEAMHQEIKNSRMVIFENAGHNLHEDDPARFTPVALQFLRDVESGVFRRDPE